MTAPAAPADLRPRTTGYWVGGALVGVGFLVGALLLGLAVSHSIGEFRDLGDDVDAMDRISVPGEGVVTIDGAGDRVIYVEGGGGAAPIATLSPTEVTVESIAPDSTPIPVRNVSVSETYDLSGHSGRAALEFTVDEPGDYRIAVEEAPSWVTNVAVGPHLDLIGPIGSIFVAVFVPAGVGGVLVLAGAVVLIVTGVRRSAAQRQARVAAAPPVSAWGPVPAGSPYLHAPPGYAAPGPLPPGLPLSAYPPPAYPPAGWLPPGPVPIAPVPPPGRPAASAWPGGAVAGRAGGGAGSASPGGESTPRDTPEPAGFAADDVSGSSPAGTAAEPGPAPVGEPSPDAPTDG